MKKKPMLLSIQFLSYGYVENAAYRGNFIRNKRVTLLILTSAKNLINKRRQYERDDCKQLYSRNRKKQ